MSPLRISIVEDIAEIRHGPRFILAQDKSLNCVADYTNAEEALSGLTAQPPDIVIMDINLPDGSGLHCMQKVEGNSSAGSIHDFHHL